MTHNGSPKKVVFTLNDVQISEILNHGVIAKGFVDHSSNVYKFTHFMSFSIPSSLLTHANESFELCHERFIHINYKYVSYLCDIDMVIGLPNIIFSKGVCQGCILGKHSEREYERFSHERTSAPIDLIHSDIIGNFPHISMIQSKYVLTFINEFSRFCWVYFLKLKSGFFDLFKVFKALVEN